MDAMDPSRPGRKRIHAAGHCGRARSGFWSMGAPARERHKDARQGRPPLGPAGEGPCRGPRLPEPRRHLAGVHWIFATIPAICDDLHQAFVVAKGAATNTAAGSADCRRVSVGAQAGARWRGRQGCEVQEE